MLDIYRASAGSGKTHLLTGYFLKLLFRRDLMSEGADHLMYFNEILAVTFTNKATAEMKTRIIEELHLLSTNPEKSFYYQDGTILDPSSSASPQEIARTARAILTSILNDYSDFNISTIDSFFQKIVRSFARELSLQGNYEVELDADKVFDAAVTSFIDNLDQHDRQTFDWMLSFSKNNMENGEGWDFRKSLLSMATNVITSEAYRRHSEQIATFTKDKNSLSNYVRRMRAIVTDYRNDLKELGTEAINTFESFGLSASDFSGKSKSPMKKFEVWSRGEVKECGLNYQKMIDNPDMWFAKTDCRKLSAQCTDAINELLKRGLDLMQGDRRRYYNSAMAILKNIYQLGILALIDQEAKKYCSEQSIMLLANTTEMLNRLVEQDDAPFIYEKMGTRIRSFMIDEFQDTSGMQWRNFMPLLSNSIALGEHNLIVGDVKQSIYRWRGGDWGLLYQDINSFEPASHNDDNTSLRTNYRSLPEIVNFNNTFFQTASKSMDALIGEGMDHVSRIYADVAQHLPTKVEEARADSPGLVEIQFFMEKESELSFDEYIKQQLPLTIIKLQEAGFRASEIAVLCRKKENCSLAAETLLRYKNEHPDSPWVMDIISGEALKIASRPVIKALISLMRYLQDPRSTTLHALAYISYFSLSCPDQAMLWQQYTPETVIHPKLASLTHHSLYELTEGLIALLPPCTHQEIAFLQAFRDMVLEFVNSKSSDLSAFLEWWDLCGCNKSIATPEDQEAIRIMTVHKSKGLGMPAAIIIDANWKIDIDCQHKNIIWCSPKEKEFMAKDADGKPLDLIFPIEITKDLDCSIFQEDFRDERLRTIIDNLNTAYVAFTRAKEAMIIFAPHSEPKKSSSAELNSLEKLLYDFASPQLSAEGCFTAGSWHRSEEKRRKADLEHRQKAACCSPDADLPQSLTDTFSADLPHLSMHQSKLVADSQAVARGNCIHDALSVIKDYDNIEQPLRQAYVHQRIDASIIGQEEMLHLINQLLANEDVRQWFKPGLQVLNEQTILNEDDDMRRPDRIVITPEGEAIIIDYKTGDDHRGYRKQVAKYMALLKKMGFDKVKGYLWFIEPHKIVEVHMVRG